MSALALSLTGLQESAIRGTVSSDGVHVFSLIEFITKVCQYKDAGNCARKEFKRLIDDGSEFHAEVMGLVRHHKFPGTGQRSTPVMALRGLQRLLVILGSKVAADYRVIVDSTFTRILAGDMSFVKVVDTFCGADAAGRAPASQPSASSSAPPPGPASVTNVPEDSSVDRQKKRKVSTAREEQEFKLEMEERLSRLRDQALSRTERMVEMLMRMRPGGVLDEGTAGQIEEQAKQIVINSGMCEALRQAPVSVQSGSASDDESPFAGGDERIAPISMARAVLSVDPIPLPSDSISVSLVASTMDVKCSFGQLKEVGKRMAARYRATHQRDPPKHRQQIGGNIVAVNTYTEVDRGMMEAVIREYMQIL